MEMHSSGMLKRAWPTAVDGRHLLLTAGVAALAVLGLMAGCKQAARPSDQQLTSAIQAKIQGEETLAGQDIQVSVSNGVVTLSGAADNDAARALAGNDAGSVSGVKTVVNNLLAPPAQRASAPPPAAKEPKRESRRERRRAAGRQKALNPPAPPSPPEVAQANPAPMPQPMPAAPAPPPPPPKPVITRVTIPAGTLVPVTLTETLDSKTAEANQIFHGALASDLVEQGVVAIPRGAPVLGQVIEAKKGGHFSGEALLSVELTEVTVRRRKVSLTTEAFTQNGAGGRGKNTAEKSGGGAVFGAIVGAVAGGGKGAGIGALAGGGAGAAVNAVTRGKEAVIPSETRIDFRLQTPITVTVEPGSPQASPDDEPHLVRPQ